MGKGQIWSVDLAIGMLVFLLAVGTIYSLLNAKGAEDPAPLRIESEVVATVLTTGADAPGLRVADENKLDMIALGDLANRAQTDYEQIKDTFGIDNNFCIFLEDEDGNLVCLQDSSGQLFAGIGPDDGKLNLTTDGSGGIPCGRLIS